MRFRKLKKQSKQKQEETSAKSKVNYTPVVNKIKAFITDMFMIYAPILYIITYAIMGSKEEFQASQLAPFIGVTIYGIVDAFLISRFTQTPGKKAYSMKVVDDTTYENISFFRALFRFFMFLFSATFLLGLFTGFYRKDKKPLHDIICNTIEIQSDK